MSYYPDPELRKREIFKDITCTSVLDVGAGHGGVFDIDFWENNPRVARKSACDMFWIRDLPLGWSTQVGVDVCKLDEFYAPESFDFVQCCEVLEHVPDPKKALEQLVRVARKAVFITSADEMHHMGPEQDAIEQVNKYQAYIKQPSIQDLKDLGFEVRVEEFERRQIIAWLIKE